MSDEGKGQGKPIGDWKQPRYGTVPEIYANFVHASWTLFDLRVRLGQLVPSEEGTTFDVEERAAVTFSWPQAKVLRNLLVDMVASYERANGEIQPLKLPEDPTILKPE